MAVCVSACSIFIAIETLNEMIKERELAYKPDIRVYENDISLYSSHTNLDSVENGLNDTIVSILGFDNSKILEKNKRDDKAGLGRIVSLNENIPGITRII